MSRLLATLLSAALYAGASLPAQAAEGEDIRCIVVLLALSEQMEQSMPNGTAVGVMYFMGKLEATSPDADIEALIRAETTSLLEIGEDIIELESIRCGEELIAVGEELEIIGESLTANPPV